MTILPSFDIDTLIEGTIQKIKHSEDLYLHTNDVIELIQQLKGFELGRSMLTSGVLTSTWVDYMCHNEVSPTGHSLETWFLSKAPKIRAARERYYITREAIQNSLKDNMVLCVLPCGVISKIAELDFSSANGIKVVGYDNDIHGLVKAELKMQHLVDQQKINLYLLKKNIWLLDDCNQHDLILSNRLSVLEPDSQKIVELFERFYTALRYNGIFVCSFFTPSPLYAPGSSPWKNVDEKDMLIEESIFVDIMDFRPAFRSEDEMILLLNRAGFKIVNIYYDTHHIYPTIISQKN